MTPTQTTTNQKNAAAEALAEVLRDLHAAHAALLDLAQEHRRAIAVADAKAIESCVRRQNEHVQRIAALEQRRSAVVASISPAGPATTLTAATAFLPPAHRERLGALGAALRDVIARVQREHAVIRAAAETLATHMDGLMKQVSRRLSHTGVYSRVGGGASETRQIVTALDLTT